MPLVWRQSSRRLCFVAAISLIGITAGLGCAIAAPATPAASGASLCTASARSREELRALLADTAIATPAATTGGQTLPEGTPATADDAAAMTALIQHWLACQNAGEPLRAWSLFSDGYLYRLLSRQGGLTDAAYASLATPSPSASVPATIMEITGERVLPDDRLGATVTIAYPSVPMPKRFFVFFTRSRGHLQIDGILGEISFALP